MAAATAVTCVPLTGLAVPASVAAVTPGQPGTVVPFTNSPPVGVAAAGSASPDPVPASLKPPGSAGAPPRQLLVPDLIAAIPAGITSAQVAKIGKLSGVRAVPAQLAD